VHVQVLDCRFLTSANGAIGRCEIYLRSAICNRNFEIQNPNLRLRMARVVELNAFRQEPLAASLPSARERGAASFCFHARAKAMLAFACALRWLVSPFHKTENNLGRI
jgi:hypothetical protein